MNHCQNQKSKQTKMLKMIPLHSQTKNQIFKLIPTFRKKRKLLKLPIIKIIRPKLKSSNSILIVIYQCKNQKKNKILFHSKNKISITLSIRKKLKIGKNNSNCNSINSNNNKQLIPKIIIVIATLKKLLSPPYISVVFVKRNFKMKKNSKSMTRYQNFIN